ncbi:MAG: NAD(P)H-dependent oxidoreductase [Planctomycetes bacterium]|nr:NAD(P)H-dependent oxidoreductase [Planctomycetota bacterium]
MTKVKRAARAVRVVGICGSLRPGSYTRMALDAALAGAAEAGAETGLIDLRAYELPMCTGNDKKTTPPPGVLRLRDEVRAARGILLATPEYHGGYSGVLKNALDLMGFEEFEGKMIGLVGVAGGKMGAGSALDGLREVARALHAWVVPEQASIPQAWQAFDEKGRCKDAELEKRLGEVGRQVAHFARLHTAEKAGEFLRLFESAAENPGGENR